MRLILLDRNKLSPGKYNGIQGAARRQWVMAAPGYSSLTGSLYRTQSSYWIGSAGMSQHKKAANDWQSCLVRYLDCLHKATRCELISCSYPLRLDCIAQLMATVILDSLGIRAVSM
jgi:hypothetical protein